MISPPEDKTDRAGIHFGGIRFDGTITAGNVLTAVMMAIIVAVWGIRLEGRVNTIDTTSKADTIAWHAAIKADNAGWHEAIVLDRQDWQRENNNLLRSIQQQIKQMSGEIDILINRPSRTP